MMGIYKSAAGAEIVGRRYREILDAWPVPAEERIVRTRFGETHVVISGPEDAAPLVLLHGSGANAGTWVGDIACWASCFRVYAVDMLGEPGGSAAVRLPLASDALASCMDDVLDGLGVRTASFVGMSLGGWTVLDYAIRRPSRVQQLSLLCPGGIGRQTMGWLPRAILLRALGKRGRRKTVAMVTGIDTPTILDDVVLVFSNFNPRTEKLPIFTDENLRALAAPVQVIVGDRDVMFDSAETVRRVRHSVPNAAVTVVSGAGHAIIGQTDRILSFLQQ